MKAERVLAICRDAGCLILGLTGIGYQQYTGNVNALLLGAYMALLGIPVGANLRSLRRDGMGGTTGTRGSSSSSASSRRSSGSSPAAGSEEAR